jgi:uncharacterized caspase-like protein
MRLDVALETRKLISIRTIGCCRTAVQSFGKLLQSAEVALFYFAGHGVQVFGSNYLVPVNANVAREADVGFQMLDLNLVLQQMQGSGTRLNMIILDACRNTCCASSGTSIRNRR